MWKAIRRVAPISLAAMFVLVAGECEDDEPTAPETPTGTIRILLDHTVAGASLVPNQMLYTTAEGNDFQVNKLVWILSRVSLFDVHDRHGRSERRHIDGPEVHLRDAFDDGSRVIEITGVPTGVYTALSFDFGLDEEMNAPGVTYTQPGFEDRWIAMTWPPNWGGGYHYMILEGFFEPEGGGPQESFLTHLGRRNAQNDPVHGTDATPFPHFFDVHLDLPTNLTLAEGETWEIQVLMDVAEWYTHPNDIDLDNDEQAIMIMMNTAAQDLFEANGATVFSVGDVTEVN
jgi:hypothetical protein